MLTAAGSMAAMPIVRAATPPGAAGPLKGLAPADDFMLEPGITYLQTGSTGATPRTVMEAAVEAWKDIESSPTFKTYGEYEDRMDEVRAKAALFIGAGKTDEIVLTKCTTEGLNSVAQSLRLAPGDRVLTTDQEHPGGRCCWDYLVRTQGIGLDVVAIPPGEDDARAILTRFEQAVGPRTKALMFSHVLTSSGLRMPVAELAALARSRGCLSIVDGAQAVGGIDVNVRQLACDVYATSGHKWLLGPKGTGFLYIRESAGPRVDLIVRQDGPRAYSGSVGVGNMPGIIGLGRAFDYLSSIGIRKIEAHNLALRNRLHEMIRAVPQAHVVSAGPGPLATPLLTYRLPDHIASERVMTTLREKHNIIVKVVPKNWMNGHRISSHLFNDESDLENLTKALKAELG